MQPNIVKQISLYGGMSPPPRVISRIAQRCCSKEIVVPNQTTSRPASAPNSFGSMLPMIHSELPRGAITKDWLDYVTDAYQRGVLFLDLLRRRGNEEEEITARPMATVLRFDHEVLMSG